MENEPGLSRALDWTKATPQERLTGLYTGDPVADYTGFREIQEAIIADEQTAEQAQSNLSRLGPSEGTTDNSRPVLIQIVRPGREEPAVKSGKV